MPSEVVTNIRQIPPLFAMDGNFGLKSFNFTGNHRFFNNLFAYFREQTGNGSGIDCSSEFGRNVANCEVNCEVPDSCLGAVILCPRYTKGEGNCTVNCVGDWSCQEAVIVG